MKHVLLALLLVPALARAEDEDAAMGRRIQGLLRAHQAEVFACVGKQKDEVTGEALLRVFIGAGETAAKVEVLKVEAGKPGARAAADCVAAAARTWKLGSLGASAGNQVVFPLAFKPQGPDTSAIGAQVQRLALRANMTLSVPIEHATALYVLGPGAPTIVCGDRRAKPAVGDVVYLRGECEAKVSSKAAGAILAVQASGDPPHAAQLVHAEANKTPPLSSFGGKADVRLFLDGTDAPFAVDLLCAKKGVEVPTHEHAGSDEIVYVVSGQATTRTAGQDHVDKAGDVVSIPRGTPHGLKIDQDLCAVQVYAPAGPEQRFKTPPAK